MEESRQSLLEPEAKVTSSLSMLIDSNYLYSMAISLKRIADRMDDIASGTAALNVYTKEG